MHHMEDWLAAQARARPTGWALHWGDMALTYGELNVRVAHLAAQLARVGVASGRRIAVLLPSSVEAVLAIHALARLGAVAVLLNTRLTPHEIAVQLRVAPCDLLLYTSETAATVQALSDPPLLVCIDGDDLEAAAIPEARTGDAAAFLSRTIQGDEPLAVLFTSGTTGTPKAALLSYGNLFAGAMASAYRIGVRPEDRWLCVLPLFHVGGLSIVMRSCLYGTAVDLWPRFDARAINAALAREPITLISLVPTMLYRMLDVSDPPLAPRALRLALLGGATTPPELVIRAHERGVAVAPTYGLTEASSQVATATPEQALRKPGSVGTPLLFTCVRVLDEEGHEQAPGGYGEIVVSGPTVMQGYLGDADASGRALRNGWLHTGDIGYRDADGDLWLVQRRSDLIVSGGENVYPVEVEQVLRTHPAVADVAVAGVPSSEWGQQVAAALVRCDPSVTEREILTFCRERLAGYKQPRLLRFVAAIPRNAAGKVVRAALLELLDAG